MNVFSEKNPGVVAHQQLAVADVADDPADAERLARAAECIEQFLCAQVDRLEGTIDRCRSVLAREAELSELSARLREERLRWDQEREDDFALIERETMRLAEAWLKLESRQRQSAATNVGVPTPTTPTGAAAAIRARPGTSNPAGGGSEREFAKELAVRQFQQLRREIGKHARRAK